MALSDQIRRRRLELGLSLTELARLAQVSKGYLSQLESSPDGPRPSADVLYRIAVALGATVGELLERPATSTREHPLQIPRELREYAAKAGLEQDQIEMLAHIKYKGEQPRTVADWRHLWETIQLIIRKDISDDSDEKG